MTIFLTIITGVVTYVLAQLVMKLIIEPVHEFKKLIAYISFSLIELANIPASCINYLPGSDFTLSNAVFSGQNGVWLKFTASELKPQSK